MKQVRISFFFFLRASLKFYLTRWLNVLMNINTHKYIYIDSTTSLNARPPSKASERLPGDACFTCDEERELQSRVRATTATDDWPLPAILTICNSLISICYAIDAIRSVNRWIIGGAERPRVAGCNGVKARSARVNPLSENEEIERGTRCVCARVVGESRNGR